LTEKARTPIKERAAELKSLTVIYFHSERFVFRGTLAFPADRIIL
jgi:hypothetical protein